MNATITLYQEDKMSIGKYLKRKYGMGDDALIPTEWLQEELHLSLEEAKRITKRLLKRKTYPAWISFESFTLICSDQLEST